MRTDRLGGWASFQWLALFVIAALFIAQLAALWVHRVDYPLVDDWRYYRPTSGLPDSLSFPWLFASAADTLHVTGKLFDWWVLRGVTHDYRMLAALSFVLGLGGWLLASLMLCLRAGRERPILGAAVILAFVVPLAAAPYWVTTSPHQYLEPAIAYHQMLPMLGLSLLGLLLLARIEAWPRGLQSLLAVGITLVVSLVYSSGAVAALVFGLSVTLLTWVERRVGPDAPTGRLGLGLSVSATAAVCLALHILLPISQHGINPATQARAHALTWPTEPLFWQFLFGLSDRAFLATDTSSLSDLRGAVALSVLFLPIIGLGVLMLRRKIPVTDRPLAIVVTGILASVFAYAVVVTYGRATFGEFYLQRLYEPDMQARVYAHNRFFYWWLSASWPFALLAWAMMMERLAGRRVAIGVIFGLLALSLIPKPQQDWDVGGPFRSWNYQALYRRDGDEVRAIIEVDIDRFGGGSSAEPRRRAWRRLPPELRNPRYRIVEPQKRTIRRRQRSWARAEQMNASFTQHDRQ